MGEFNLILSMFPVSSALLVSAYTVEYQVKGHIWGQHKFSCFDREDNFGACDIVSLFWRPRFHCIHVHVVATTPLLRHCTL